MSQQVRFWVDPICPWCWVTARWIRTVAPRRDLAITWEPISLAVKNEPAPDSPSYPVLRWSHGLLRVMESVRAAEGDGPLGDLYLEYGRRIHHDKARQWPVAEALAAVGLDVAHASAAEDEAWDLEVRSRMDEGLLLVGKDVGTPIISITRDDGMEKAAFGPVITRVPPIEDSLRLWDAFTTLIEMDGFWEIKRTRTESPDPGERP